ncbi:MAG: hypothetical protein EP343_33470 [Deltaproteobacteria bacterium]|nr:MAG: hypothetical protein EP343_33470 [Deltaproteobacteria bacterium]
MEDSEGGSGSSSGPASGPGSGPASGPASGLLDSSPGEASFPVFSIPVVDSVPASPAPPSEIGSPPPSETGSLTSSKPSGIASGLIQREYRAIQRPSFLQASLPVQSWSDAAMQSLILRLHKPSFLQDSPVLQTRSVMTHCPFSTWHFFSCLQMSLSSQSRASDAWHT